MSHLTTSNTVKMMVGSSSSSLPQRCKSNIDYISTYLATEDVLIEIFLRLPLNYIFKLRCVSKLWHSFLSNPSFITGIFNSLTSPPWTLFYQLSYNHYAESHPSFVRQLFSTASPDIHFQFISGHDGLSFRFLREDKIYLLASSNGLVLCSTNLSNQSILYICNPLTKKWVSLPPPRQHSPTRLVLTGFICDSSLTFTSNYKVVRIPEFRNPSISFNLEIFSFDTGGWKTHKVSCPQEVTILNTFSSNVVTLNGILYWIEGRNRIIAYNLNHNKNRTSHECRLINLPKEKEDNNDVYSRCLGESQGFICYCQIQRMQMTLSVWELEENYSSGGLVWHLVDKNIQLKDILAAETTGRFRHIEGIIGMFMRPLAFNPVDRNVVILSCDKCIFAYNIRTRRSELLRQTSDHLFCIWALPFVLTPKPTTLPPSFWSTDT